MILDSLTVNFSATEPVTGDVELIRFMFSDPRYNYIWRNLEGEELPSNLGIVSILAGWKNSSGKPVRGHIETSIIRANNTVFVPRYTQGNDILINPGSTQSVMYQMTLRKVPLNQQGLWEITGYLTDSDTGESYDELSCVFQVGSVSNGLDTLGYTKPQLRQELEAGIITNSWWGYEDSYRRKMGILVTQWFSVEEFGEIDWVAYSYDLPNWNPATDPNHDQLLALCGPEAGIRYALIGGEFQPESNLWYYSYLGGGNYIWKSARQNNPFLLPVAKAAINAPSPYPGHFTAALQVGLDMTDMNNWVFFNHQETDIQPGNAIQMPIPGDTIVQTVIGYTNYGNLKADGSIPHLGYWEY